jgi:hypothetical protein
MHGSAARIDLGTHRAYLDGRGSRNDGGAEVRPESLTYGFVRNDSLPFAGPHLGQE